MRYAVGIVGTLLDDLFAPCVLSIYIHAYYFTS